MHGSLGTLKAQSRAQLNKPMANTPPPVTCSRCGEPCSSFSHRCGAAKEEAEARRSAAASSRIADPEGKHLEICRLQLAATVERLEACREWVQWCSHEWSHRRVEDWPPKLIAAARAVKLIPENDKIHP